MTRFYDRAGEVPAFYFKDISDSPIVAIDTETTGLDPFKDKVIMLQIGTRENQYIIDTRKVDAKPWLAPLKDKKLLGHNLKFDYKFLRSNFGFEMQFVYDTQVAELILNTGINSARYGLKHLVSKYLDIELDKETRIDFLQIKNQDFSQKHIKYGADDVIYPFLLKDKQQELLKNEELLRVNRLEQRFILVLAKMEYNGVILDTECWSDMIRERLPLLAQEAANLDRLAEAVAPQEWINKQISLFGDRRPVNINWDSPTVVAKFFMDLGIDVRDKYGKPSVASGNIYRINNPLVKSYLEYKEKTKTVSTYGENWYDYVATDGRIHPNFWPIVSTGRMSSRSPNMQNVPADQKVRQCFIAGEDKVLIIADYSQQESRILADFAQEPDMIKFYLEDGGDLHSWVASKMFNKEVSKKVNADLRQKGKVLNFALAYGASAWAISKQANCDMESAQHLIDLYFDTFPALKNFFAACKKKALSQGYILIDPLIGRKSYYEKYFEYLRLKAIPYDSKTKEEISTYYKLKGSMERNAVNYVIQGSAGTMLKLACIIYENDPRSQGTCIINLIHDEIIVEASQEVAQVAAEALKDAMIEAGALICKTIPMAVEPELSLFWKK